MILNNRWGGYSILHKREKAAACNALDAPAPSKTE